MKRSGSTLILRGGQKRILSLDADQSYEEKALTTIEFNRIGEVMSIRIFTKKDYDNILQGQIYKELTSNPDLVETMASSGCLSDS